MSDEFKKEIKIVNNYASLLEKYAGYWVVDEKYLRNKKKDIQKAIKMLLVLRIADNQKYGQRSTSIPGVFCLSYTDEHETWPH